MRQTITQPQALEITTARADELQNWINRGHIVIEVPNPGRGKSRRYTATDCALIAVAVRLVRFGVSIDRTRDFLAYVERRIVQEKPFRWEEYFSIGYRQLDQKPLGTFICADTEGAGLGISEGDMVNMRIATSAEWFRAIEGIVGGQRRRDGNEEIIPKNRELLARRGAFAEPFLFFPLGEIVNGTLLRFDQIANQAGDQDKAGTQ